MPKPPKGLNQKCVEELDEVAERKRKHSSPTWQPLEVTEAHLLHFFIDKEHYQGPNDKPRENVFEYWGMSVIVEGIQFESVDLKQAIVDAGANFVGAVYFKAADFLKLDDFEGFKVIHDPYPFFDKKTSTEEPQHKNHAEVICKKSTKRLQKMQALCDWSYHPVSGDRRSFLPDFQALYPRQPEPTAHRPGKSLDARTKHQRLGLILLLSAALLYVCYRWKR